MLTTAQIRSLLNAAPGHTKDSAAQKLISAASPAEIRALDVEGVLRLYQALVMFSPSWVSSRDSAALDRLAQYSQFQPLAQPLSTAIALIKRAKPQSAAIQSELSADLVNRLYAAEASRLDWYEKLGIDGETIGRGQLSQKAYLDIREPHYFKLVFEGYITHVWLAEILKSRPKNSGHFDFTTCRTNIPARYDSIYKQQALEDFVVAAYLAVRILNAERPGRSVKDTMRFAVGSYHGMFAMMQKAQQTSGEVTHWEPVAAVLRQNSHIDALAYVNEVVN